MFQGFSDETIDFLWGIRLNNDRSWFEPRKEEYKQYLYQPMKELSRDVYERFAGKYDDLELICKVSRIYRDARRLHGRGPYKDHLWFSVAQPADTCSRPAFWFELAPEGYSFGLGYWMARAVTMAKLRARMDQRPREMEKLARLVNRQDTFTLGGEEFKRRKPAPSKLLEPWYNRKGGLYLEGSRPVDELLYSAELSAYLAAEFDKLVPLYRYLTTLDGDPDPRDL